MNDALELPRADTTSPDRAQTLVVFAASLAAAILVRIALWPTSGLVGDLDQFVVWVHGLATAPLARAYDQNLSFPPVMVYIWGAIAALEPAFRTVTTSADPAIRAIMKTPASLADLALGAVVTWHLRSTPRWAITAALLILLHPAVIYVSAWWGQYESIYVLFGVVAFVLAVRGRPLLAAAFLGLALMTKPQALPFIVPFAAWLLAHEGWQGAARGALVVGVVALLLWLPFIPAGGIQGYAHNLADYQGGIFAILSLRAWNLWWLVQELLAGGSFVADGSALFGPVTLRTLGYGLALLGEVAVFLYVYRARSPRALALGLATASLVAFSLLTTMHERYAFAVLAFLPLAFPDRRALWLLLAFSVVFTLNLVAAAPPFPDSPPIPVSGPLSVAGSVVMLGLLVGGFGLLRREALRSTARPVLMPDLRR